MTSATEALAHYAIDGGDAGKRRLDLLARVHGDATLELLRAAGIRPGMRCLDLGCGGGHVAIEMARLVGRWGHVVGVDADPRIVALAAADVRAAGCENVDIECADVLEHRPDERGFHLAYARFLLSHLPEPERAVERMRARLEPGGIAAVEDIDCRGAFSHPESAAFRRSIELYRDVVRHRGGDAEIGARLPRLLRDAGLEVLGVRVFQPAFVEGEGKLLPLLTFERVCGAIVAEGLATADEVARVARELRELTERRDTLIAHVRTIQVWARKIA